MNSYTVLGNVKAHQKEFTVFVTDKNKYVFLRRKDGKYYYPLLEDLIVLDRFAKIREDIFYSKTSNRVAAFLMAAIIGSGLISGFLLYTLPPKNVTIDKEMPSHFVEMTPSPIEEDIEPEFTIISENPTLEELLQIYHKNVALEGLPEMETLIRAIVSYDPELNHYNFARNLELMTVYYDTKEVMDAQTDVYADGLWFPYSKEMHFKNDCEKETKYHEGMHSAESYRDDYESTGFTYANDPEFDDLGGFMYECGNEYFLNRLGLKQNNSTEMISMIAFSSIMGDKKLIRTYYNGTVKDFALEVDTVIGNMEETKNLIRLLDLYHNYQMNDSLQNPEEAVEMSMEMQMDLFDRIFDYMAKGLKEKYDKDGNKESLHHAVKRMDLFLQNETEKSNLFIRANILWKSKCDEYLSGLIERTDYSITRNTKSVIYQNGDGYKDISEYLIGEANYINEYGDQVFGKVLLKESASGTTYYSLPTLAQVTLKDDISPYPLDFVLDQKEYSSDDLDNMVFVARTRKGELLSYLYRQNKKAVESYLLGDFTQLQDYFKDLSFTKEEISHFNEILREDTATKEDTGVLVDHIFQKKLSETTNDVRSVYAFLQFLYQNQTYQVAGENLAIKYRLQLEQQVNDEQLKKIIRHFNYNNGRYNQTDCSYEKRDGKGVVVFKEEMIKDGELKKAEILYQPEDLIYAFTPEGNLVLYDEAEPDIDLFTGKAYTPDASKGEIPFAQTISPETTKEILASDYTFKKLLTRGLLDGLFEEKINVFVDGDQIQFPIQAGNTLVGFWLPRNQCRVLLTDMGAIVPHEIHNEEYGISNKILVGQTVNILTNRVITKEPTIYETISFDEYCNLLGITMIDGVMMSVENGEIVKPMEQTK